MEMLQPCINLSYFTPCIGRIFGGAMGIFIPLKVSSSSELLRHMCRSSRAERPMKVLLASTPFTGHFNPILVAARILKDAGHETAIYTSVIFRERIERERIRFMPLPEEADQGVRDRTASFF